MKGNYLATEMIEGYLIYCFLLSEWSFLFSSLTCSWTNCMHYLCISLFYFLCQASDLTNKNIQNVNNVTSFKNYDERSIEREISQLHATLSQSKGILDRKGKMEEFQLWTYPNIKRCSTSTDHAHLI